MNARDNQLTHLALRQKVKALAHTPWPAGQHHGAIGFVIFQPSRNRFAFNQTDLVVERSRKNDKRQNNRAQSDSATH
jgi:hypothetical protein